MKYAGLHLLLASVAHAETSIIYQAWGNPAQGQTSNEIARAFAKADPGIKVDIQLADGDCYWEKLRVLVAGSTPPDVVAMDALLYPDWQSRGVLLNLQPYLDGDPIIPDGYFGLPRDFQTIPITWTKAAHIDGASLSPVFFTICLPLSKPALAAFALFAVPFSRNDLFSALISLPPDIERTTGIGGLALFQTQYGGQ